MEELRDFCSSLFLMMGKELQEIENVPG